MEPANRGTEMAKRYAAQYANGHRVEFTAAQCHQAQQVINHDGATFFLAGVEVPAEQWFADVLGACEAAWAKKEQTHKRVRVLHGSSAGNYIEKWVKR